MQQDHDDGSQMLSRSATYEPLGTELFKLTLSRENKAEIFGYGLTKLDQSQQEASTILDNIARWDPQTRLSFASRSVSTILSTPFRLVYPNSDLPSFEETGLYVRQYMAVSYCWRSEDFLPRGYERHGSWPISKPFVDAIIGDKNHPRVGIWMDQLCIDQTSSIDKQKSVAAMDIIYRSCLRLLVLLEDVYLNEAEVLLIDKYDPSKLSAYDPAWRPPVNEHAALNTFYDKINAARWWQRAWCYHEFNVNEPWTDKRKANEIHNATFITNGPAGSTAKIKWWTLYYLMGMAPSKQSGQEIFYPIDARNDEFGWRSSIMTNHNGVSGKGCLLLEDKVSIMINLCGIGFAYQGPALSSTDEVFYVSTLLALAGGETYPLTTFGNPLSKKPSWLQRQLGLRNPAIASFEPRQMRGIHHLSMQSIELDLLFLPPPAKWIEPVDADMKPTHVVFPGIIATTQFSNNGPVDEVFTTPGRPDADLDMPRRRFLATCIRNGPTFTARLWTQLKRDIVDYRYNHQVLIKDMEPSPSLSGAADRLLKQLYPVSFLLGISPSVLFTFDDAHLFLTWLTDPRSVYYISVYTWWIQCTVDGQGAMSTHSLLSEEFPSGPAEELRAAVPTELLDTNCENLRIWLMQPTMPGSGKSTWRLVGKALLLGESDLKREIEKQERGAKALITICREVVSG